MITETFVMSVSLKQKQKELCIKAHKMRVHQNIKHPIYVTIRQL